MWPKISKAEIDLIVLIKSATTTDRWKRNKEEKNPESTIEQVKIKE